MAGRLASRHEDGPRGPAHDASRGGAHETVQPFAVFSASPEDNEVGELALLDDRAHHQAGNELRAAFDAVIGADSADGFERGLPPFFQDHGDVALVIDVGRRSQGSRDIAQEGSFEQFDVHHMKSPDRGRVSGRHRRREPDAHLGGGASVRWHQDVFDHVSSIPFVEGTPSTRGSVWTASSRARAKALNKPSIQ